MDPVSSLALFCNVLDLTEKAVKCVKAIRHVHSSASGLSQDQEQLDEYLKRTIAISDEIQGGNTKFAANGRISTRSDTQIEELAKVCGNISSEISAIIEYCRSRQQRSFTESARATFRSLRKKNALEELEKKLKSSQQLLQTLLSVSTRHKLAHAINAIQDFGIQQAGIQKRLENAQAQLASLQDVPSHLKDALKLIQKSQKMVELDTICRRISAVYPQESNPRYHEVLDAHKGTYEWILDERLKIPTPLRHIRVSFVNWVLEGSGVFHVAGKPGAGKSTLMKFIHQHAESRRLLTQWSAGKKLLLLRYFFWRADPSQNSINAFQRSLLCTALSQAPELLDTLYYDKAGKGNTTSYPHLHMQQFTNREVADMFDHMVSSPEVLDHYRIFIMVDGLDELDDRARTEDHNDLVKAIKTWSSLSSGRLKVCASSREMAAFTSLSAKFKVCLQDLTKEDMIKFVSERIRSHDLCRPRIQQLPTGWCQICNGFSCGVPHTDVDHLTNYIVSKAQGVFLWVHLLLKNLRQAMDNGLSVSELRVRVEETPEELDDFLKNLFNSMHKQDKKAVFCLIQILRQYFLMGQARRLRELPTNDRFYLITRVGASALFHAYGIMKPKKILEDNNYPQMDNPNEVPILNAEQLQGRCNGLLEVSSWPAGYPIKSTTSSQNPSATRDEAVTVIHRSIYEVSFDALEAWTPRLKSAKVIIGTWACWMVYIDLNYRFKQYPSLALGSYAQALVNDLLDLLSVSELAKPPIMQEHRILECLELIDNSCNAHLVRHSANPFGGTRECPLAFLPALAYSSRFFFSFYYQALESGIIDYVRWKLDRISDSEATLYESYSLLACSFFNMSDNSVELARVVFQKSGRVDATAPGLLDATGPGLSLLPYTSFGGDSGWAPVYLFPQSQGQLGYHSSIWNCFVATWICNEITDQLGGRGFRQDPAGFPGVYFKPLKRTWEMLALWLEYGANPQIYLWAEWHEGTIAARKNGRWVWVTTEDFNFQPLRSDTKETKLPTALQNAKERLKPHIVRYIDGRRYKSWGLSGDPSLNLEGAAYRDRHKNAYRKFRTLDKVRGDVTQPAPRPRPAFETALATGKTVFSLRDIVEIQRPPNMVRILELIDRNTAQIEAREAEENLMLLDELPLPGVMEESVDVPPTPPLPPLQSPPIDMDEMKNEDKTQLWVSKLRLLDSRGQVFGESDTCITRSTKLSMCLLR
ncbi:hypothetical protein F4778DRAFT_740970 [Xylariomycetidae sp. FL2044]|nr:hypothetical protein F4778DRAFT_740970 [Xylariomycetidae sp. FL2044]